MTLGTRPGSAEYNDSLSMGHLQKSPTVKLYHEYLLLLNQFLARDSIYAIARYMPSPVRLSVRLSVTRVDQSKRVEVRITQPSPQSSPMTSFLTLNFTVKFQREHRERGRRMTQG